MEALDDDRSGAISILELADFVENGELAPAHSKTHVAGDAPAQDESKRAGRARALMGLA